MRGRRHFLTMSPGRMEDGISGGKCKHYAHFLPRMREGRNMKTRNKFQTLEVAIAILVGAPAVALALAIWLNLSALPITDNGTSVVVRPPNASGLIHR